ncbi:unnamed protein product [Sphenostylis stenocarpa]|uniref:Uncharacterized protein n=1 Tax=Sphenostylis stenocarpa TaxID=92480 RepID=A0AA86VC97_9FABA|nr:unnamed protein product [Sphenostylis stenocarpa]
MSANLLKEDASLSRLKMPMDSIVMDEMLQPLGRYNQKVKPPTRERINLRESRAKLDSLSSFVRFTFFVVCNLYVPNEAGALGLGRTTLELQAQGSIDSKQVATLDMGKEAHSGCHGCQKGEGERARD